MSDKCPQCGAIGCKEKYGEVLALEFEQPTVFGAVHHITVMCYNLQHPDTFSDEALTWMRSQLRDIVEKGLTGPELLKRTRRTFRGDARVTAARPPVPTARPPVPTARPPVPTARPPVPAAKAARVKRTGATIERKPRATWSTTVMDLRADSPEIYVEDIKAWARSILKDLDAE